MIASAGNNTFQMWSLAEAAIRTKLAFIWTERRCWIKTHNLAASIALISVNYEWINGLNSLGLGDSCSLVFFFYTAFRGSIIIDLSEPTKPHWHVYLRIWSTIVGNSLRYELNENAGLKLIRVRKREPGVPRVIPQRTENIIVKNRYGVGIALSYLFDSKYCKLKTTVFNYYKTPTQGLPFDLPLMCRFIAAPWAFTNNWISRFWGVGR